MENISMRELLLRRRQLLIRGKEKEVRAVCFKADGDQTVALTGNNTYSVTMQYSYDGDTWENWDLSALSFGGSTKVYIRGIGNSKFGSTSSWCTFTFSTNSYVYISGIIETLLDWETEIWSCSKYEFYQLFEGQTALRSVRDLVFASSNIGASSYGCMFWDCTNLLYGPKSLPGTLTGSEACSGMFRNCTSLITAPELPATTLTSGCYYQMFYNCTSLITAPELPATTLTSNCYRGMFYTCSKLSNIICRAKVNANSALSGWVYNVARSGTLYGYSEFKWSTGMNGTPSRWKFIELTD